MESTEELKTQISELKALLEVKEEIITIQEIEIDELWYKLQQEENHEHLENCL